MLANVVVVQLSVNSPRLSTDPTVSNAATSKGSVAVDAVAADDDAADADAADSGNGNSSRDPLEADFSSCRSQGYTHTALRCFYLHIQVFHISIENIIFIQRVDSYNYQSIGI